MPAIAWVATRAILLTRLLARQIYTRSLRVELEPPGLGVLDFELFANDRLPDAPPGPELGNFLEYTDGYVKKEGKSRKKLLRVQAVVDAVTSVLDSGRQGECHRFRGRGAGLLHVLAHYRQRVPAGPRAPG